MIKKSTLLHLRVPFSFYLLPVFFLALSLSEGASAVHILFVFLALHLFLYPASNGYNSYFDKDKGSIGGLEHPPEVSKELYYAALFFDLLAIIIGLFVNWTFAVMLLIYGLVSKAYSHPSIRLKKYPFLSWFVLGFFQGIFTFMMALKGLGNLSFSELVEPHFFYPGILTSILLWGSYPMTQVYQHKEDAERGDLTLSRLLGIRGTFYWTILIFTVAIAGFLSYYYFFFQSSAAWWFLLPIVLLLFIF